jgi:speckle-type POZ protein
MQHLLVAADRYGVDRLKLMCEEELCRGVDMQSVACTLAIAEQHQCVRLKDKCVRFIVSPGVLGAIMKTDGFKASCCKLPFGYRGDSKEDGKHAQDSVV